MQDKHQALANARKNDVVTHALMSQKFQEHLLFTIDNQ